MKLIDAQKYLAAAYTAGTNGRFKFCELPKNLRGKTLFQQAVQTLGYVDFDVNGYIWVDPAVFPTPEMQEKTLNEHRRLTKAQWDKRVGKRKPAPTTESPLGMLIQKGGLANLATLQEELPDMKEAPTVPTVTLETLNILAVNLQKVLRNQEAIAKEFDVKLPKWVDM